MKIDIAGHRPPFHPTTTDTRSPTIRLLEILESLDEETRDRILLGLCAYFGHTVQED